jgi:valyl-tRNA synthetase
MPKKELPKTYNPADYEDAIYEKWEQSGFFNPDNLVGEPYSIMMPPPNVTGVLHLGHALENSLMDIMARYQRMNGKKVLLVPGTDHAAVATQAKVEKVLMAKGVKNPRQDLGREKLLAEIRIYAENSKATILKQIKKMGTSCDWSRLAYTFDEARSQAVNEIFVKMYNDGLIYRGHRVVNWSVKGQSTCSDDELVHVARKAKLYTFKYSKDFPLAISTTRPETKLGDTAVAVNPKDKRYKKYIGKVFSVDIGAAKSLEIKIITDESVDMNFGTGALGVTPAHSMIDYEMNEKQKAKGEEIGLIQVIGQDGKMTLAAGANYAGLPVLEAREKFVVWLRENGLLEQEEEIEQNVGTSDRFGDAVEALPMTQWFVDVNKKIAGKNKSLKDLMRDAVTVGHNKDKEQKITITPERFEKVYLNWIDNLRDWCISRQIWWGHRIPVWYKGEEKYVGVEAPTGNGWTQDEDTLDTWFSSGMWTFSTLARKPEQIKIENGNLVINSEDFTTFHPTSWMQMGYEIIYLWLVRMVLMSTYALDQIPFKDVYIHGMLRDAKGQKFSKSSGNNLDPIEVANKYGTDALRLSLVSGIAPGNDSKFYEEKVESARNLVNKLWNISRYIITNYQLRITNKNFKIEKLINTVANDWIINIFNSMAASVKEDLDNYRFSQASESLSEFTRDYLADWYLEICKFEKNKDDILFYILTRLLKLWHPFVPFVTEAIWQEMGNEKLLMVEYWAKIPLAPFVKGGKNEFEVIKDIIIAIRNARAENKVEPARKIKAVIYAGEKKELIESQAHLIKNLRTGISELETSLTPLYMGGKIGEKIKGAIYIALGGIEIYLIGAVDSEKEKVRLEKEIANLENVISAAAKRLANKEFTANAPAQIVDKEKVKLSAWQNELTKFREQLKNL